MEDGALLLGVEDGRVEGGWGDETRVGEGSEEMIRIFIEKKMLPSSLTGGRLLASPAPRRDRRKASRASFS